MEQVRILYADAHILVCVKPAGILSTDEPGGLPSLVRNALGDECACVQTVHRLDRVVSGLMVLARTPESAARLSQQIRERVFDKQYLAVIHGYPLEECGTFMDLLFRDKAERKTYVVTQRAKGVQEAVLHYRVLHCRENLCRVWIHLETGRTHQIRAQFSSRGFPLVGDRKYGREEDGCSIALWSYRLLFTHPATGEALEFFLEPPATYPWDYV